MSMGRVNLNNISKNLWGFQYNPQSYERGGGRVLAKSWQMMTWWHRGGVREIWHSTLFYWSLRRTPDSQSISKVKLNFWNHRKSISTEKKFIKDGRECLDAWKFMNIPLNVSSRSSAASSPRRVEAVAHCHRPVLTSHPFWEVITFSWLTGTLHTLFIVVTIAIHPFGKAMSTPFILLKHTNVHNVVYNSVVIQKNITASVFQTID